MEITVFSHVIKNWVNQAGSGAEFQHVLKKEDFFLDFGLVWDGCLVVTKQEV